MDYTLSFFSCMVFNHFPNVQTSLGFLGKSSKFDPGRLGLACTLHTGLISLFGGVPQLSPWDTDGPKCTTEVCRVAWELSDQSSHEMIRDYINYNIPAVLGQDLNKFGQY